MEPYLLAQSRYLLVCLLLLLLISIILGATGCLRAQALWHTWILWVSPDAAFQGDSECGDICLVIGLT